MHVYTVHVGFPRTDPLSNSPCCYPTCPSHPTVPMGTHGIPQTDPLSHSPYCYPTCPSHPTVPMGTRGIPQTDWQYGLWDSGSVCGKPMYTHWYSGTGRTGGIAVWTTGQSMGIACIPFAKHHVGLVKVPMSQWTLVGKTGHYCHNRNKK